MARDPADDIRDALDNFFDEWRKLGHQKEDERVALEGRLKSLEVKMQIMVAAFGAVALAVLGVIVDRLSKGH